MTEKLSEPVCIHGNPADTCISCSWYACAEQLAHYKQALAARDVEVARLTAERDGARDALTTIATMADAREIERDANRTELARFKKALAERDLDIARITAERDALEQDRLVLASRLDIKLICRGEPHVCQQELIHALEANCECLTRAETFNLSSRIIPLRSEPGDVGKGGELARFKSAAAAHLKYDMQSVLSNTPGNRMRQERNTARAELARVMPVFEAALELDAAAKAVRTKGIEALERYNAAHNALYAAVDAAWEAK